MNIQLSEHFTYKKLIRFTLPSIGTIVFTSVYGVVDGFFVSNFAGKIPFAALNFIMPFIMILSSFGFMFGTGGSALIAKTMGEGDMPKARRQFSFLTYFSAALGVVIAIGGIVSIRFIASVLGAKGELLEGSVLYGRILLSALPFYMIQQEFQSFFVMAEKPQLGLISTVAAGVTNIILDALFIAVYKWGLAGAAAATALSQVIGGLIPLIYFSRPNTSLMRLTTASFDGCALLKTVTNGSSELMSNLSMSLVGMLYNMQLLKYAKENGVAAYGVMMYLSFMFVGVFLGYSIGSAPVISYHFGAQNHAELKNLLKKSLVFIAALSFGMLVLGEISAKPLSVIFVGYDQSLFALTKRGFTIFSFSFLFSGAAIFGSGFFTALNNGGVSAGISGMRLLFQVCAILFLPLLWGTDGIWASVVAAELLAAVLTMVLLIAMRKKYHY